MKMHVTAVLFYVKVHTISETGREKENQKQRTDAGAIGVFEKEHLCVGLP